MIYRFYVYIVTEEKNQKEDQNEPIKLDEMEHVIDLDINPSNDGELFDALNEHLPLFLVKHNLEKFIPTTGPTSDKHEDGSVSICYYHNQIAYDFVYQNIKEGYIMFGPPIEIKLRPIYHSYGLDDGWYDDRINPDLKSILTHAGLTEEVIKLMVNKFEDLVEFEYYDTESLKQDLKDSGLESSIISQIITIHEQRIKNLGIGPKPNPVSLLENILNQYAF